MKHTNGTMTERIFMSCMEFFYMLLLAPKCSQKSAQQYVYSSAVLLQEYVANEQDLPVLRTLTIVYESFQTRHGIRQHRWKLPRSTAPVSTPILRPDCRKKHQLQLIYFLYKYLIYIIFHKFPPSSPICMCITKQFFIISFNRKLNRFLFLCFVLSHSPFGPFSRFYPFSVLSATVLTAVGIIVIFLIKIN